MLHSNPNQTSIGALHLVKNKKKYDVTDGLHDATIYRFYGKLSFSFVMFNLWSKFFTIVSFGSGVMASQKSIQNLAKHLRRSILQKYLNAFNG